MELPKRKRFSRIGSGTQGNKGKRPRESLTVLHFKNERVHTEGRKIGSL
jgi:hypothetical protein